LKGLRESSESWGGRQGQGGIFQKKKEPGEDQGLKKKGAIRGKQKKVERRKFHEPWNGVKP